LSDILKFVAKKLIIVNQKPFLACEIFEESTPCGENAYCSSAGGSAECVCEDGYETDPDVVRACRRPDPCNDVDCPGTFTNSECAIINSLGKCLCSNNYEIWQDNS